MLQLDRWLSQECRGTPWRARGLGMPSPYIFTLLLLLAVPAASQLTWETKNPMPRGKAGMATAFLGDDLVLAGGTLWENDVKLYLQEVTLYDTSTDRWRQGPPLPVPLAYGGYMHNSDGMEIFGGTDGERVYREIWKMDAGKTRWRKTGAIPEDLLFTRVAKVGQKVYLVGGCPDVADLMGCTDAVYADSHGGVWKKVSRIPDGPTAIAGSAVVQDRVYLFGGCSMPSPGKVVNRDGAYSYDPKTDNWKTLRSLPRAARGASAAVVDDRYVYLFAGYAGSKQDTAGMSSDVLIYDVETDTYHKATPLPVKLMAIDFFLHKGTFYGAGGEDRAKSRSAHTLAGRLRKTRR